MDSLFGQYNQAKLGPENDYQTAMGLLGYKGGYSPSWMNYESGKQDNFGSQLGSAVGGTMQGGDPSGDKLSMAPEASGGQPATPWNIPQGPAQNNIPAYDMPMTPQSAMGMVKPTASSQIQWPSYSGGDSGSGSGGGGMDSSSLSSIAGMFADA